MTRSRPRLLLLLFLLPSIASLSSLLTTGAADAEDPDDLLGRIEQLERRFTTLREDLDDASDRHVQLVSWRDRWVRRYDRIDKERVAWVTTVLRHYRAAGRALVELPDMPDFDTLEDDSS